MSIYSIGQEIEVSLPGERPFRARVWKDTNPYTLWYERKDDGTIDFAGREYIRPTEAAQKPEGFQNKTQEELDAEEAAYNRAYQEHELAQERAAYEAEMAMEDRAMAAAYQNGIDGSIKRYCTECRARLGPKEDKVCGECIGFAFR